MVFRQRSTLWQFNIAIEHGNLFEFSHWKCGCWCFIVISLPEGNQRKDRILEHGSTVTLIIVCTNPAAEERNCKVLVYLCLSVFPLWVALACFMHVFMFYGFRLLGFLLCVPSLLLWLLLIPASCRFCGVWCSDVFSFFCCLNWWFLAVVGFSRFKMQHHRHNNSKNDLSISVRSLCCFKCIKNTIPNPCVGYYLHISENYTHDDNVKSTRLLVKSPW